MKSKREKFIIDLAQEIVDTPAIKRLVREMVLFTLVEQEQQRELGAVQTFFRECERRGVRITLADDGTLYSEEWNRLGADLSAVLTMYRVPITAHLQRYKDMAEKDQQRYLAEKERAAKNIEQRNGHSRL
jgi:hypothetical protein